MQGSLCFTLAVQGRQGQKQFLEMKENTHCITEILLPIQSQDMKSKHQFIQTLAMTIRNYFIVNRT